MYDVVFITFWCNICFQPLTATSAHQHVRAHSSHGKTTKEVCAFIVLVMLCCYITNVNMLYVHWTELRWLSPQANGECMEQFALWYC